MLPFKLLFRNTDKIEMPMKIMKSRLKDSGFTSLELYNYYSEINLTNNVQLALNNLSNNKNIVIQKSDKGNSVALLDKDKCLERMCKISNNNAKFELLQFDHDKELNFVLNLEKMNYQCSDITKVDHKLN